MTKRLARAFDEAAKLPDQEQDVLAAWLLEELSAERRWAQSFGASSDRLVELADEALADHREGRTQDLDPDKL